MDGNYIHDPGFAPGDHTNGIYVGGGTQPLTISGNTIFDSLGQTDAINLDAPTPGPSAPVANKTIKNNLLAGGSYTIYGGAPSGSPTTASSSPATASARTTTRRAASTAPSPTSTALAGNTWTGNIWDTTGQAVTSP